MWMWMSQTSRLSWKEVDLRIGMMDGAKERRPSSNDLVGDGRPPNWYWLSPCSGAGLGRKPR